jgi:hypothetical protein
MCLTGRDADKRNSSNGFVFIKNDSSSLVISTAFYQNLFDNLFRNIDLNNGD